MFKILLCVGTRPNFVKIAKLKNLLSSNTNIICKVLHTNQHFDYNMSDVFFKQLNIGQPDIILPQKSGNQLNIISQIINESDEVFRNEKPDLVMVPGDVNSSLACALSASRNNIALAHIESGLRSFDRRMPEEINRILIDDLSDIHFVTEPSGMYNLTEEGKNPDSIYHVGNTMIDSLVLLRNNFQDNEFYKNLGLEMKNFGVVTFHRPSNVDNKENLKLISEILNYLSQKQKIVFPIHPRTRNKFSEYGVKINEENIVCIDPLSYIEFISLINNSSWVVTDSGGIQEETTFLGIPCITLRENTERPVTLDLGTNTLSELDFENVRTLIDQINSHTYKIGAIPEFWDGNASDRIVDVILNKFGISAS